MNSEKLTPENVPAWAAFETALRTAGLPTDDLTDEGQRFFSFDAGAAFGGFARVGEIVLLRSILVAPGRRGTGLGRRVLADLLEAARLEGATAAWLLTTSAEDFFARHGFAAVDRASAPAAVAACAQFTGLCPASAVLMRRQPL